jgi:predicted nucleic acid-binding protein
MRGWWGERAKQSIDIMGHMAHDMKLVLDTDVVLSGLRSRSGASRLMLCGAVEGAFVPIVTVATMLEYEAVLTRDSNLAALGLTRSELLEFLEEWIGIAAQVLVEHSDRPRIRDAADELFVDAALNGQAAAIVTFNRRDYLAADPRSAAQGETPVAVLSPGEALRRLPWRPSPTTLFAFRPR